MKTDEPLQVSPIFPFNRGHLLLGGERELVMLTGLLALILIVVLQNLYTAVLGGVLLVVMLTVAQKMAKADPQMTQVYRRFSRYQRFYPAGSTKYTQLPTPQKGRR